jgi:hypothetical protein
MIAGDQFYCYANIFALISMSYLNEVKFMKQKCFGAVLSFFLLTCHAIALDRQLIINGDAESNNVTGWINNGMESVPSANAGSAGLPGGMSLGNYCFTGGAGASVQWMEQEASVSAEASSIDSGQVYFLLSLLMQSRGDEVTADLGECRMQFLDGSDAVISSYENIDMENLQGSTWKWVYYSGRVPEGTRKIDLRLTATRNAGSYTDAFFDNVSLRIRSTPLEPRLPPSTFSLDPTSTFLRTNQDSGASNPSVINLTNLGLMAGDWVYLEQIGDFVGAAGNEDVATGTIAIFSSDSQVLDGSNAVRVPGAVDAGTDFITFATHFGNLPTDIPEDFKVTQTLVQIPTNATRLMVGVHDSYHSDNTDPDADLGIRLTPVYSPNPIAIDVNCLSNTTASITWTNLFPGVDYELEKATTLDPVPDWSFLGTHSVSNAGLKTSSPITTDSAFFKLIFNND